MSCAQSSRSTTYKMRGKPGSSAEQVTRALALGRDIIGVVRVRRHVVRDPLGNLDPRSFEAREALAIVDTDRLKQVFWNLCDNAFRAMSEGGTLKVSLRARGSSCARRPDRRARVRGRRARRRRRCRGQHRRRGCTRAVAVPRSETFIGSPTEPHSTSARWWSCSGRRQPTPS